MNEQDCLQLVYAALRHVNEIRPPNAQVPETPDVVLAGDDGLLDSLALTTLILNIESGITEKTGREVPILGDPNLTDLIRDFRSPLSIAHLILRKV